MRRETTATWIALCLAALTGSSVRAEPPPPGPNAPADEPEARALYENMFRSIRSATSLSYESAYQNGPQENNLDHGTYKVWMKKPNYFRVETRLGDDDGRRGILIGDGQNAWSYWPNGRPFFSGENTPFGIPPS
jgi:outer membrane lipoprotein-sorting protein